MVRPSPRPPWGPGSPRPPWGPGSRKVGPEAREAPSRTSLGRARLGARLGPAQRRPRGQGSAPPARRGAPPPPGPPSAAPLAWAGAGRPCWAAPARAEAGAGGENEEPQRERLQPAASSRGPPAGSPSVASWASARETVLSGGLPRLAEASLT